MDELITIRTKILKEIGEQREFIKVLESQEDISNFLEIISFSKDDLQRLELINSKINSFIWGKDD